MALWGTADVIIIGYKNIRNINYSETSISNENGHSYGNNSFVSQNL